MNIVRKPDVLYDPGSRYDPNDARKFALEMAVKALPASGPAQQCEQAEKYYQWLSAKWCRLER